MPIVVVPDRRALREPLAYRPIRGSRETSELGLVLSSPRQAVSFVRARVKAEVIERLRAATDHRGEPRLAPRETMPSFEDGKEVDKLLCALVYADAEPGMNDGFCFDHQTGRVACVCDDGGIDERELPSEPDRYEWIEPLTESEISLLTDEDLAEIAERFRRSRGFN